MWPWQQRTDRPNPRRRYRPLLEPLELRLAPASGTYVEDFSKDTNPSKSGFDTPKDGVQISHRTTSHEFVKLTGDAASPGSGKHALRLPASPAEYLAWTYHTSEDGGLEAWEKVTAFSVSVRGNGSITFFGDAGSILNINAATGASWQTFSVTAATLGDDGSPLGEITNVYVRATALTSEIYVDDVTIQVEIDPAQIDVNNEVRVKQLGPDLAIIGDDFANAIRVNLGSGVLIVGIGGTTINGQTEISIPGFEFEDGTRGFRDIYITMKKGYDFVEILGAGGFSTTVFDDLLIDTGSGDSDTVLHFFGVGDLLGFQSKGGQDVLEMMEVYPGRFDVRTGEGNDEMDFKVLGALVGDTAKSTERNLVQTGAGNDRVDFSGYIVGRAQFDLGGGADRLDLFGGFYSGFEAVLGSGDDTMGLSAFDSSAQHPSAGFLYDWSLRVDIDLGAGSDRLELDAEFPDNAKFGIHSGMKVNGGPGGGFVKFDRVEFEVWFPDDTSQSLQVYGPPDLFDLPGLAPALKWVNVGFGFD